MRVRTTVGAVVVVAVALTAGAALLVLLLRGSLHDGLENAAEVRAGAIAQQLQSEGVPSILREDDDLDEAEEPGEVEPAPTVSWVLDAAGQIVVASQDLPPPADDGTTRLPGGEHSYVVVSEQAGAAGSSYDVMVAVSLEEVDDSTAALIPLLAGGLPLVLLVVAGTTWLVVGRALRPVERIRVEVAAISDDQLDRRVPVPQSRDELHRLATTMNQMLARLEAARERQQRFVSDASHELRSPLASLRQSAEVSREHPGALPTEELVDTVLAESIRMQRIVEQLLALTRVDEHGVRRLREVDLDDLALAEAARISRQGLQVDLSGVGAGRVRGEEAALSQVVRNLVDNAVRHAASRIAIGVCATPGWVFVLVEDDGDGVPFADRERIFERFVRLDDARGRDDGGTGLGLAIVDQIARAHDGQARVEDSPLGGARFVVALPTR